MHRGYQVMRECVKHSPLPLLDFPEKLKKEAELMLPYSTGIEIECTIGPEYRTKLFSDVPDIMNVDVDGMEQRYRIPNGIKGMICLYRICELLKEYSLLNPTSGIHYHIDCSDWLSRRGFSFIARNNDWVMKSLKSWGYTGHYNRWECSERKTAVKYNDFYSTIEFRIGEMTFDYSLMMKRIIHCQNIVKRLREKALRNILINH